MTPEERNKLVEDNMGLAYSYAQRFCATNMEYEDLAQEGMIGLMDAVDRFDPNRGVKFSTYAVWHIRKSIMEAIRSRNDIVRTPRRQTSKSCTTLENADRLDDTSPPPDEALAELEEQAVIHKSIHECLRYLTLRDSLVIQLRHGVNVPEPMTLKVVGALLDVTPERVRQIQRAAEKKLRALLADCVTLEETGAITAEHRKESAQNNPAE
jgi:RNA polymerase primary sigma factor